MTKRVPLIVAGPLPPPTHGVTVSTDLVLRNPLLRRQFTVDHLDTSDHRTGRNLGTWDARNVLLGVSSLLRLIPRLIRRRGVIYLPLSQSRAALVRDTLFIQLATLLDWRVAAHLRGSELHQVHEGSNALFRAWLAHALRRVHGFAVMGATIAPTLDGLVPAERVAIVPNGTPDTWRGTRATGKRVLFLSNLMRRKGIVEAVEAAILVCERVPEAEFKFVGAWESPELERALRASVEGAGERIEFVEHADPETKTAMLHWASVFLFPPVEPEGHPRVVLEALSTGLPVVTTDRGAIRETVLDGDCGYVLPEPDPRKLAEKVLLLLEDDPTRERMARAARARYEHLFTQEHADRVLATWLASLWAARAEEREAEARVTS